VCFSYSPAIKNTISQTTKSIENGAIWEKRRSPVGRLRYLIKSISQSEKNRAKRSPKTRIKGSFLFTESIYIDSYYTKKPNKQHVLRQI
jgi:hypothetical protein